ncbi:hypothetical protein [Brevundimonas vesicularis]|uniref:hypothetical protein n=1 Tax=Brevundimonas vesicularis TaxID=41276 RepID=UPI0028ACA89C|nr:hypothetical protein [Brevundimonas vesicularis]
MSEKNDALVYGFKPDAWERLPEWLQTFVTESNERNAHAHHSAHRHASQTLQDQAWKASDFVLKTLVTVQGGSLVAILAFLGSLTQRRSQLDVAPLLASLGGLGLGLLFAIAAAFCAYFVAVYYAAGHDRRETSFSYPFVQTTPEGEAHDRIGETFRLWGIGFAVASLVSAVIGIAAFGLFTVKALTAPERVAHTSPMETVSAPQIAEKPAVREDARALNPEASRPKDR